MIKKISSLLMFIFVSQWMVAQTVAEYYSSAKGTRGKALKTALYQVIKNHKERTYNDLWEDFKQTDCRADGKVWDMYSNVSSYSFGGSQQGASASAEGVSYNREHSFPKSWFSEGYPMYSDLFHLYPVDTYINSMRSNLPFGETDQPKKTSKNGWSKYGPSSVKGYSGTVFEPNDEYKGDFARTYFYMATRYENVIAGWTTKKGEVFPMLNSTSYPVFSDWALNMLLRWAKEDPVSQKEIDRNNAVYKIQQNRNPYIDYPGLEQYVWGDKTSVSFDPDNYVPGGEVNPQPDDKEVAAPVFSVAGGEVKKGTEVVISCATGGATIYYQMDGGAWKSHLAPATVTIERNVELSAYAQVGEKKSATVKAAYTLAGSPEEGGDVYVKIKGAGDLVAGAKYLIVCEEVGVAMSDIHSKDYRNGESVSISSESITTKVSGAGLPYAFTLGNAAKGYTFYDAATKTYLAITSNSNKLHSLTEAKGDESLWTVSFADGGMQIYSVKFPERLINYNKENPRFVAYKLTSNQLPVYLFKQTAPTAIEYPFVENGTVDVYTIDGRLLRDDVNKENATRGLNRGVYLIGGVKVLVR